MTLYTRRSFKTGDSTTRSSAVKTHQGTWSRQNFGEPIDLLSKGGFWKRRDCLE